MRGYWLTQTVSPPHNSLKSDYNVERTGSDFSNNSKPDRLFPKWLFAGNIQCLCFLVIEFDRVMESGYSSNRQECFPSCGVLQADGGRLR